MGDEGLEDATVPAGGKPKKEAGEEHGGQYYCCHGQFVIKELVIVNQSAKWRCQRNSFSKKREKAGGKDEQEPFGATKVKISELPKVNFEAIEMEIK